jgi:ribonuclease-3
MPDKDKLLNEVNQTLPCPVRDFKLFKTAFVHSSYLNEKGADGFQSNERLEFLGDSVLSCVIGSLLYERFPGGDEGELTGMRARLVNKKTLYEIARRLGLGDIVLLGKGEKNSGGGLNPNILASALEALIAAIFLDSGFKKAEEYITGIFDGLIEDASKKPSHFDFKPELQRIAQAVHKSAPAYRLKGESGPAHKKIFEVEAVVGGVVLGKGAAASKKEAEQQAARQALERLKETKA